MVAVLSNSGRRKQVKKRQPAKVDRSGGRGCRRFERVGRTIQDGVVGWAGAARPNPNGGLASLTAQGLARSRDWPLVRIGISDIYKFRSDRKIFAAAPTSHSIAQRGSSPVGERLAFILDLTRPTSCTPLLMERHGTPYSWLEHCPCVCHEVLLYIYFRVLRSTSLPPSTTAINSDRMDAGFQTGTHIWKPG